MGKQNIENKTKVLFIVESFSTGVYAIVRDVSCNLNKDNFDVLILHSLRDDSPSNYEKDFQQQNIKLQYLSMGSIKDYFSSIKNIKNVINSFKPDVIHFHSSKAGFLGRLSIKNKKTYKLFYTPHGFSFLRTDVGAIKRSIFFQLEYWINKVTPSKIIAVSKGEQEQALKITNNILIINNFINIEDFKFDNDFADDGFIVTCGRITAARNPYLFNEIAKSLPKLKFKWIGDGPLRNVIDAPNIEVTGLLARNDAIKHVKDSLIYLQTSLWEGMPVALLEAMASAKSVIASNIIGNKDLVTHNETGLLCDLETSKFVESIKELNKNKKERIRLGLAARKYIEKNHDVKVAIKKYENEYSN
jgi:glycosyltransferase involved in cell wall biosynthesis